MQPVLDHVTTIFPEILGRRLLGFLPRAATALLILVFAYLLWRLLAKPLHAVLRKAKLDETAARFLELIFKYSLLILAVVTALGELGVNTGSMLASLGVAGLTIGFAAKDALSNIISGLFIFWDRPFVLGDLVEVDGRYGRVEAITLRSTRVVTPDGKMLAIPNSTVVNSTVSSYTNFPHLRLDVSVSVAVNESLGRVREILLGLVTDESVYMRTPPPVVVVTALNDFNVALELRVWIANEFEHIAQRVALRERMFEALTAAGVDMPFETFRLAPVEALGSLTARS